MPLDETVGEVLAVGPGSKRVRREIDRLRSRLGPDLGIIDFERAVTIAGGRFAAVTFFVKLVSVYTVQVDAVETEIDDAVQVAIRRAVDDPLPLRVPVADPIIV